MTHEDRQRIRQAIDAHKRAEYAHIRAVAGGVGRCRECTSPYEDVTPGCKTCLDRERIRAKRGAVA